MVKNPAPAPAPARFAIKIRQNRYGRIWKKQIRYNPNKHRLDNDVYNAHPGTMQATLSKLLSYCVHRRTQSISLSGTENEYWPKGGDALRLGVKTFMDRVW